MTALREPRITTRCSNEVARSTPDDIDHTVAAMERVIALLRAERLVA
jgi:hypothetical protein